LRNLTSLKEEGGILPRVSEIIENFDKYIVWEGPKNNIPSPSEGCV